METLKVKEFYALSDKLKEEGSSINEFVKEVTGKTLNEAPAETAPKEEITARNPGWLWLRSPKGALAKKTLTRQSKKLLKSIKSDILEDFYNDITANQKKVLQQAQALIKNGQDKKAVFDSLSANTDRGHAIRTKQLKKLDDSIDDMIANASKKITGYIAKKDVGDNVRLTLENYWVLLSAQIHQVAYNIIIKKETEFIHSIVGEDEDLVTFAKENLGSESLIKPLQDAQDKKVADAKNKVKEGGKDEEGGEKKVVLADLKKGEEWNYESSAGKKGVVVVVGPEGEGVRVKVKGKGGDGWVATKPEAFVSKVGGEESEASGKPKETEKPAEETMDLTKYKKGEEWKYKNSKGKEGTVIIIGAEDGGVKVKQKGKEGSGWVVRKPDALVGKIKK